MNYLTNFNPMDRVYNALRRFLFAQIYPAPKLVNRGTRVFIGLQQLVQSLVQHNSNCQPVWFDNTGNAHPAKLEQPPGLGYLEGMFVTNSTQLYDPAKKYIISLGGNTTCYQVLIPEMLEIHKKHAGEIVLLSFNPPGVGQSLGSVEDLEHYCDILKTIIDSLHRNDIPYDHIMVMGHSLGGGIAAHVVADYQQQDKNISLFVDRTMLSMSETVAVTVQNAFPIELLRKTLGYLLYLLAKLLVKFLKLELEVAQDFKLINKINPGAAHGMMAHEDEMLSESCLSHELPASLPYFQQFRIMAEQQYRRSHSIVRANLFSVNGKHTADDFFHAVVEKFKNQKKEQPKLR